MVTEGAWFQNAAYPYLTTVTCAGHATISTGSFPNVHGVFQNAWWDRDAKRQMSCTQDPAATDFGYSGTPAGGDSAYRLQVPTFTDQMRSRKNAHVAALALKDRSAIMLAGRGGDAVVWMNNALDGWVSSTVYASAPVPAVNAFITANPISADLGKTWDRMLPADAYKGPDDGVGEAPPQGWTRSFPHVLNGTSGKADGSFVSQWERSPFADQYVGRFAESLVEALQLGKHDGVDVLAISFSSPDLIGHAFGPNSHEVEDTYARLDLTMGALFDRLDAVVGKGRWVAGLSADHGVTPIPEQLVAEGKDAGRIDGGAIVTALEALLRSALGPGRKVTVINTNDIYFEPGVYDRIRKSRELTDQVIATITSRPGIQRVFRSEEIRDVKAAKDPLARAAALSYFPGRSGDLVMATKPGWMISSNGTTHGSASPDDQRVPVLFVGAGIKPGKYSEAATPADVTPTLAAVVGLSMKADGHALSCITAGEP
jgi:predicted AlkP superfamily pyrophosphatase or phosphodiesterase